MTPDPWSTPRLQATVEHFLGVGSDADLPQPVRFVRSVSALIRRRVSFGNEAGGFAYFVLHPPRAAEDPADRETTRVAMLDLGHDRVSGRLWYVNCVANDGLAIEIAETEDHAEIVNYITDELGLGDAPTLVFDMTTDAPVGRYFANGLSELDTVTTVAFTSEEVRWERIRESVDGVHRTNLVTPALQNRTDNLWKNAEDYWVASDAEYKVQSALKAGLAGAFPYCDIRSEQPQAQGRHDLLIEEYAEVPGGSRAVIPHAMIELKVLRSRNSSGDAVSDNATQAWAVSGVQQAHAYGTGRHSRLFLTLLFDARYSDASTNCLEAAHALASQLGVIIGRWKLYGKASDYRDDLAKADTGE